MFSRPARGGAIPSASAEGASGDMRSFAGAAEAARADKARMTRAICERQPSRRLYGDEIKFAEKLFRAPPSPVGRRVAFFEKKAPQKSKTGAHLSAAGAFGVPRQFAIKSAVDESSPLIFLFAERFRSRPRPRRERPAICARLQAPHGGGAGSARSRSRPRSRRESEAICVSLQAPHRAARADKAQMTRAISERQRPSVIFGR